MMSSSSFAMLFIAVTAVSGHAARRCPDARYLVDATALPAAAGERPLVGALVLRGAAVEAETSCGRRRGRVRASRAGDRVTVRLARCPGVRRLAITATLTADCDAMEGTLRRAAPRRTHRFDARRTRCGDGRTDAARGEACDGSGCPAGEPCTPDCTCGPAVLPPSPTSTTSTSAPTTSSTTSSTRPPAVCGNGRREPGERCDGSDSGNGRCPEGGPLGCTADCLRYDFSTCFRCGNGLREGDEQCDGRDLGGAVCDRPGDTGGAVTCRYDCRLDHRTCWRCGNGRVDGDEACDDGNTTAGDGCSPTCMLE